MNLFITRPIRARPLPTVTGDPPTHSPTNVTSHAECLPPLTTCSLPRQVTIEKLSDKVLLKIFCRFLDASPRHWHTLMHICRKWRRTVFDSRRTLQLQLFCSHGIPILDALDCWSALPSLRQLLDASRNLVDLLLHEVLDPSCFPPEALTNTFSGMVQLQSLSLHFPSTSTYLAPPPLSRELVVLPALNHLNFQGTTEYLERLVARIDTPILGNIEVTFVEKSTFDLSQLCKFITRIGMHSSPRRVDILSSEHSVSISLTRPLDSNCLKFQAFRRPLSEQLFIMARIFYQFSAFLYNVEDLRITAQRPSNQGNALHYGRWLEPITSFIGVKWLYVSGNLWNDVVCSLQLSDRSPESVLPALHKLCILQPGPRHAPLSEAVVSLMTSFWLSDHPIAVEYEQLCRISELHVTGTVYDQCWDLYLLTLLSRTCLPEG